MMREEATLTAHGGKAVIKPAVTFRDSEETEMRKKQKQKVGVAQTEPEVLYQK